LFALALCAAPASADLSTGLIAYYPFSGNAQDASGNGNDGTPNANVALTTDRFGTANRAYFFNGSNAQILVPNSASLSSPTNQITMCAWILLNGNSQVGQPFWPLLMKSNTTENAFMYRVSGDLSGFGAAYNNWSTQQGSPYTFALGVWTFVAVVYDGAQERYYVNGTQVGATARTLTMTADTRPLVIGGDAPGVPEYFWGKIDDMRIYSRALSNAEIVELAQQTTDVSDATMFNEVALRAPEPNPTSSASAIEFTLRDAAPVEVTVSDALGRHVRTLLRGEQSAGTHTARWDGRDEGGRATPPGVYFWRLRSGSTELTRRSVRIR
jgi:hypothetical protein